MKKLGVLLSAFILLTAFTCENEPLEGDFVTDDSSNTTSCVEAIQNTGDAANAVIASNDDNYVELCNAYVAALENQIAACGDPNGIIQTLVDSLGDCNLDDPDTCESVTIAADVAQNNLNNAPDGQYTNFCNVYVMALENKIELCGDADGSIQAIIDSLGDCSSDGGEPTEVVGTWLLTAWNGTEAIDLNNDGTDSTNFLDEMDCYNNETIVFNPDGSGIAMSTSYADIEIFIEAGTTDSYDFTVTCIEEVENTDMTWTQSGNTVSITDAFGTTDWTLNGNTLSITIPEGFSVVNTDDATVEVTQDLTFVYTKQ